MAWPFDGMSTIGTLGFRSAGNWLVVDNELKSTTAIVVLGGQMPFRAKEAVALYTCGRAQEVWLTRGGASDEDRALREIAVERPADYVYSRHVLERSGVPHGAIRVLDGQHLVSIVRNGSLLLPGWLFASFLPRVIPADSAGSRTTLTFMPAGVHAGLRTAHNAT